MIRASPDTFSVVWVEDSSQFHHRALKEFAVESIGPLIVYLNIQRVERK